MNSLGQPTCIDDLTCVQECPQLRTPLTQGGFQPAWLRSSDRDAAMKAVPVACYHLPDSRAAYVFNVQPCAVQSRWYAWG